VEKVVAKFFTPQSVRFNPLLNLQLNIRITFVKDSINQLMSPVVRKLLLTSHIVFSVGWLGAVAGFLALSIAGVNSENEQIIRAAYLSMDLVSWYVILPAALGAFVSGVAQSLLTQWGLFKHWWIAVKFILTLGATALLLLHMKPIGLMADVAMVGNISDYSGPQVQLIADASLALAVLLITTAISVYKPWGRIESKVIEEKKTDKKSKNKRNTLVWAIAICVVLIFVIAHIIGGGFHHH
jgi:hypothetical protein